MRLLLVLLAIELASVASVSGTQEETVIVEEVSADESVDSSNKNTPGDVAFKLAEELSASQQNLRERLDMIFASDSELDMQDPRVQDLQKRIETNQNRLIQKLQQAATKGHTEAKYHMAKYIITGANDVRQKHVQQTEKEMQRLYEQDPENAEALKPLQDLIGGLLAPLIPPSRRLHDRKVPIEGMDMVNEAFEQGMAFLLAAAEEGFSQAQYEVAELQVNGDGPLEVDVAAAVPLYEGAIAQGHGEAAAALSALYLSGTDTSKLPKVFEYLTMGVKAGSARAHFLLGSLHIDGHGVERDEFEGFRLVKIAADDDNSDAMHRMGQLCYHGRGTGENLDEAVSWIQRAADMDHAQAKTSLALLHLRGEGVEKDEELAKELFIESADAGHGWAVYNLGVMMLGEKNFEAAYTLFSDAAKMFDLGDAYYNVALLDRDGLGCEKNLETCKQHLNKAAERGHQLAAEMLESFGELPETEKVQGVGSTVGGKNVKR